ncbi:hypothetical protein GUJ93_ZPchr0014g46699 [Zizania palustris]|uniref:Uncharacterized protein n=1 Tax=Zizania palustris TaxID=103762 RepID=A0A8J5VV43_ZIZPA|nr:hypothetical protein GUJ93_ZPchr0014g46699 [Zizania palustris]
MKMTRFHKLPRGQSTRDQYTVVYIAISSHSADIHTEMATSGVKRGGSKRRFLRAFLHSWKKLGAGAAAPAAGEWAPLDGGGDDDAIPSDVPRGHTVVYVGEELRRYVVRVSSLDHPLFRQLLDRAREEYQFAAGADARLCIPCDEDLFLGVLCHVNSKQEYWWLSFLHHAVCS